MIWIALGLEFVAFGCIMWLIKRHFDRAARLRREVHADLMASFGSHQDRNDRDDRR